MKPPYMLLLLLVISIPSAGTAQQSACKPDDPWAEFHMQNMRRFNPCEHLLSAANVGGLTLKWKFSLGTIAESSPAVAMGMVFVAGTNTMYALNAKTGAEVWRYATGDTVYSSPAVANGVVYFGSGDNNLYALNARTGRLLWLYTTGAGIASAPTVSQGVVYVGSNDGNVYALDASTGAKLWNHDTFNIIGDSSPALADGAVFIAGGRFISALNAKDGSLLWSDGFAATLHSPAIGDGVVFVGSSDTSTAAVYAFDAKTGAQLWSFSPGNWVVSSPLWWMV